MGAQLRVIRDRIRSVRSIKKITRAMELVAIQRIAKAQMRVAASRPYAEEITKVLSALTEASTHDHPLLVQRAQSMRTGVILVTSDKGLCGAYNANVIKVAEELQSLLREQGKTPVLYVLGRKGETYYRFRRLAFAASWTGFSEQPHYVNAAEIGHTVTESFLSEDTTTGIGELYLVYTEFHSTLNQAAVAKQIAPVEVEYEQESLTIPPPSYEFEPDADTLLDALLPHYVNARIFAALLESAASESAARRRAMKAATDNASELVRTLTREANQARQDQITQEISEIVGGADALLAAGRSEV